MAPVLSSSPETLVTRGWSDYALLDSGDGRKLERYGRYTVVRPEPQCFWKAHDENAFERANAMFDPQQEEEDSGRWRFDAHGPIDAFPLQWRDVRFMGRFTPFRHLAFFPEQAANWEWLDASVRTLQQPKILNLFGYTGVASLACSAAGAHVTHVDASKKSVQWARDNATLSGLADRPIRWITEDARRYAQREARRGSQYEGIILDPPKYGRGPEGEVWRLFEDTPELVRLCASLLSPDARFLILNAYAARISGPALAGMLSEALAGRGGRIDWGELALVQEDGKREIGLSFFARWSR